MNVFSDEVRRSPFEAYAELRRSTPVVYDDESRLWMIFDYAGVKRALTDHEAFSSKNGPDWLIFTDPPRHTKLRALISQAFTPRSIGELETLIRRISRELLDEAIERDAMDVAMNFAIPLPIMVISEMLGIPPVDADRFQQWNEVLLRMSYVVVGQPAGNVVQGSWRLQLK